MKRRRAVLSLLILYLAALALIAFWPTPIDRPVDSQLNAVLAYLHGHGVPTWFNYPFVESCANVLLFVPFGLLTAAAVPLGRWWLAIILGVVVSSCIELGQLLFLNHRYATMADVEVNSFGTVLGVLAALAFRGWRARRWRAASRSPKRVARPGS